MAVAATTACGGRRTAADPPAATQIRILPLDAVVVLRSSERVPRDTSVTFSAGLARVIVLRQAPPENIAYAELEFPATTFAADKGRPVRVSVRPHPGTYALDVRASARIGPGATISFRYPRYFSAPPSESGTYANSVELERALAIGHVIDSARVALLPSSRPAADNLRAPLRTDGTYLVAAPK